MEDFKEAMMEFVKIQNECLEQQQRLDQECYERQNKRLEKIFELLVMKKEQGSPKSFSVDSVMNSIGKFKYNP